jgi:carboxymethylenebutenolidase
MDQRIINLYDSFTHGGMNRREFLDRLAAIVGSVAAAAALLPLLQNNYAQAAIVADNDPRLAVDRISYDSPKGKISAYLVRPKAKGKRPAVIVIHENRGLNPHIEDVARRLAMAGYLALAPDLLSVNGGTPPDEDRARELHQKTEREDMIAAADAAIALMAKHAESTGKVGAVGFCFGGGVVNRMATDSADLAAAVPYYGVQPPADKVPAIKAALLLQYAEKDDNINKGIAAYEAALKANNKKYTLYQYAGTQHAFEQRHRRRTLQQASGRPRLEPHARLLQGESRRAAGCGVVRDNALATIRGLPPP